MKTEQLYPYARSPKNRYVLSRDGAELARGTEQELWDYLHAACSSSVHWALKHEGYSIRPEEIAL